MKKLIQIFAVTLLVAASASAQISPGNLVVLRLGDGVQTLASVGNTIFLDQYTTNGIFVNTIPIPDTLPNGLIESGVATSEGALAISADGRFLTFGGYNTNRPAPVSVSTTISGIVPRGVGMVDLAGNYTLAVSTLSQFSANNIRSAVTDGANNFWAAGGNSGTYYLGAASAAATVQSSIANTRVLNIFNGNLYFSTGSGAVGIYAFGGGGTPTVSTATNSLFLTAGSGTGTASPYDFSISPAGTIAYVADDRSLPLGGGVQRWDFSGNVWSLTYILATGAGSTNGARSLSVDFTGANPVIYATTAETSADRVISIVDTGAGAGSAATTLATAQPNKIFRGLKLIPTTVVLPRLSIQGSSARVVISWPTNVAGFDLQSVATLAASNNWVKVPDVPVIVADKYAVTNNTPTGKLFYRLQKQ